MAAVRREIREVATQVWQHQCPDCGEWYEPRTRRQVYCCPACRQAAWRDRHLIVPRQTTLGNGEHVG